MRSAKIYDIDVEILGRGQEWTGGDMNYAGGGQKINLLKEKVNQLVKEGKEDLIVLFTDRFVIFIIISKYLFYHIFFKLINGK